MNKFICFLNSVYLTIRYSFFNWFMYDLGISGHEYYEDNENGDLVCRRCGKVSK